MGSKTGVDLEKAAESVLALGDAHGAALAAALEKSMGPFEPKKGTVDWGAVVETALAALRSTLAELSKAIRAYEREMSDDDRVRAERDEAAAVVYEALVALRESVTGVYGPSVARALGFEGKTPQDPANLRALSGQVLDAAQTVKLPKPRLAGARVELKEAKARLTAPLARLKASMTDVAREEREAQAASVTKNAAIAATTERLAATVSTLEGLFLSAGMLDLAERARPMKRGGGSAEAGDAETDEEGGTGGEDEGGAEKPVAPGKTPTK